MNGLDVILFTPRALQMIALAHKEADDIGHFHIGPEHLLLGLLKLGQGCARNVLKRRGVDLENVRQEVEAEIRSHAGEETVRGNNRYTPRAKALIGAADREAEALNHRFVGTEHLLLGLLQQKDGVAAGVLKELAGDVECWCQEVLMELDPGYQPNPGR